MKKVLTFAISFFFASLTIAQLNPVKWSFEANKVNDQEYDLVFTAHITDGWYVYSQNLDSDDGPIPTSFTFNENASIHRVGETTEDGPRHAGFDEIFDMNVVKYSGQPTFTQRVKVSSPTSFSGYLEFMTCDNDRCLPPKEVEFKFSLQ